MDPYWRDILERNQYVNDYWRAAYLHHERYSQERFGI